MIEPSPKKRRRAARTSYLDGQLLIAMPAMSDKRFARSVVYMCLHNDEGAMGLIINQRADNVTFAHQLRELGVLKEGADEEVPARVLDLSVQIGGPVEPRNGFVLHTPDYANSNATLEIDRSMRLTNTVDILKAIARGRGPDRAIVALGYAGWDGSARGRDPGQRLAFLRRRARHRVRYQPRAEVRPRLVQARRGPVPSRQLCGPGLIVGLISAPPAGTTAAGSCNF